MPKSDWIATYTGRFTPLDPAPEDFNILDVAQALSNICRYNGHCREFYSVAEHSVLGCSLMTVYEADEDLPRLQLAFLLHDSAEAYIGDICRPIKVTANMELHRAAERVLLKMIYQLHNLPFNSDQDWRVKKMDNAMLSTEAPQLFDSTADWHFVEPSLHIPLQLWAPYMAREYFMLAYETLQAGKVFTLPHLANGYKLPIAEWRAHVGLDWHPDLLG